MNTNEPRVEDLIQRLWNAPENAEWSQKTYVIGLSDLRAWMQSDDIQVLGFVENTITGGKFRIAPPLPRNEYLAFRKGYVERCFRENPDGEWADTRYSVGGDLVGLLVDLDEHSEHAALEDFEGLLARLYKNGDEELRTCIETATLEHLPQKILRRMFSDWKHDPELRQAFDLLGFKR